MFKSSIALIWHLFCRDFKAEYRQSLLGYLWALIPVLATTLTWVFLDQQNIVSIGSTDLPYPIHVMLGSMLWGIFAKSLTGVMQGVFFGKFCIRKNQMFSTCFFAKWIVSSLLRPFFAVPVTSSRLFLVFGINFSPFILLAPLGMLGLSLLGSVFGLLLIPITSLYHDVSRATAFALSFLMYLTPVVYPVPKEGFASIIVSYNPVTP